jgi:hypothetical protein
MNGYFSVSNDQMKPVTNPKAAIWSIKIFFC